MQKHFVMSLLKLIENDPWLEPYKSTIINRFEKTKLKLDDIRKTSQPLQSQSMLIFTMDCIVKKNHG